MFLLLGEYPNPPRLRWMTLALIVANVGVYLRITLPLSGQAANPADPRVAEYFAALAKSLTPGTRLSDVAKQLSEYDLFVFQWGFRPVAMHVGDLFASMFPHVGLMHLAGSMLFPWICGNIVEDRLGPIGFLSAYLLTGVAAAGSPTARTSAGSSRGLPRRG